MNIFTETIKPRIFTGEYPAGSRLKGERFMRMNSICPGTGFAARCRAWLMPDIAAAVMPAASGNRSIPEQQQKLEKKCRNNIEIFPKSAILYYAIKCRNI